MNPDFQRRFRVLPTQQRKAVARGESGMGNKSFIRVDLCSSVVFKFPVEPSGLNVARGTGHSARCLGNARSLAMIFYFLSAARIIFMYLAGSLSNFFWQDLQQSFTSWPL